MFCFGYLNYHPQTNPQFVLKCKQLTERTKHDLYPSAPSHEASTINKLVRWAETTGAQYLYVQSHGHILTDVKALYQMADMLDNETLAIANVNNTIIDESHLLINLNVTKRFKHWSKHTYLTKPIPQDVMDKSVYLPNDMDSTILDAIHDFPKNGNNIIDGNSYSFLEQHQHQPTHLYYNKVHLEDYQTPLHTNITNLSHHRMNHDFTNHHEFYQNHDEMYQIRTLRCRKLQVEIGKLVTIPRGFHPFKILQEHGFNRDTQLVFWDITGPSLFFYERMLREWDGVDFPKFLEIYRLNFSIEYTSEAWQKTLETFGGAREFKVLWDAVRQLRRLFIHSNVISPVQSQNHILDLINVVPGTYLYWGDIFADYDVQVHFDAITIANQYEQFVNRALSAGVRMDGLTPSGGPAWF